MIRKIRPYFKLIIIIFLTGLAFINKIQAEENTENKTEIATRKISDSTKVVISTSGPVKFDSHWMDNPYRLVIEFKSRNVLGNNIDKEVVVNQGVIKRITSAYFKETQNKALKTLVFELFQKVPYKIWQEGNTILLDIQAPLETTGFSVGARETPLEVESNKLIKKLEAMEAALKQTPGTQGPSGVLDSKVSNKTLKHVVSKQAEQSKVVVARPIIKARKDWLGVIFWVLGLISISGLGLGLFFWRKYAVVKTKTLSERIRELKSQLEKKDKLLEQVEIIRKTIEKTAIEKEREYEQLKLELEQKSRLFEQEATIRSEKEKTLQELERERIQLKETSESLKDVLVKRGIARRLTLPEEKGELWILGKSPERRNTPRLTLTKDFHNTVILKIELQGISGNIKSFAEDISSDGLCFETRSELDEKNPLKLRLFFYGGKVPNFRTQGWIVWKRAQDSKNYYGIVFEGLSGKVKTELEKYIELNVTRG